LDASRQASAAADPRLALQAIGTAVLAATTPIGEDDYLGLFDSFDGALSFDGLFRAVVIYAHGERPVMVDVPLPTDAGSRRSASGSDGDHPSIHSRRGR
jgi:hypothetical protein